MKARNLIQRECVLEMKLCTACLSHNRTLLKLGNFRKIYEMLCQDIDLKYDGEPTLCWECMTLLRNVDEFREKVRKSDMLLSIEDAFCPSITYSNLIISEIITLDTFEEQQEHEDAEEKYTEPEMTEEVDIKYIKKEDFEHNLEIHKEEAVNIASVEGDNHKPVCKKEYSNDEESKDTKAKQRQVAGYHKNDKIQLNKHNNQLSDSVENNTVIGEPQQNIIGINQLNLFTYQLSDSLNYHLLNSEKEDNLVNIETKPENIINNQLTEENQVNPKTQKFKDSNKYVNTFTNIAAKVKHKQKVRNYPNVRSQRYSITYQSLKWENVVLKIQINNKDMKIWWEIEKNSDHFKTLRNKCDICLRKLKMDKDLKTHNRECHTLSLSQPYSCDICNIHYPSKHLLREHINSHYFIMRCGVCGYECYTQLHMQYHLRNTHTRTVVCNECSQQFKSTRDFYVHLKSHANNVFYCDQCEKRCRNLDLLEKHIKRKHATQRCSDCNMTLKNFHQLSKHRKLKHSVGPPEMAYCAPCDLQFNTELAYKRHLLAAKAHEEERPHKSMKQVPCPVCLKVYSKTQTMMNHYRWVHTSDSKYKCEQCDTSFLNRTRYKEHVMYVHMGLKRPRDKPCSYCDKAFTSKQALDHHTLIHTGQKPHACPHCPRRYRQRAALLAHVRLHDCDGQDSVYDVPYETCA